MHGSSSLGMGRPRKWWQSREDFGPASAPGPVRYAFPLTGVKVKEEQRAVRTASSVELSSRSLGDVSRSIRRRSGKLPGLKPRWQERRTSFECVAARPPASAGLLRVHARVRMTHGRDCATVGCGCFKQQMAVRDAALQWEPSVTSTLQVNVRDRLARSNGSFNASWRLSPPPDDTQLSSPGGERHNREGDVVLAASEGDAVQADPEVMPDEPEPEAEPEPEPEAEREPEAEPEAERSNPDAPRSPEPDRQDVTQWFKTGAFSRAGPEAWAGSGGRKSGGGSSQVPAGNGRGGGLVAGDPVLTTAAITRAPTNAFRRPTTPSTITIERNRRRAKGRPGAESGSAEVDDLLDLRPRTPIDDSMMGELALWKTSPEQKTASEKRMSVEVQMPTVSAGLPVPDTPGKLAEANDDAQPEPAQPEPEGGNAPALADVLVDNSLVADIDGPSENLQ